MLSRSLRVTMMSDNEEVGSLSDEVEACSHDIRYRVARTTAIDGVEHSRCGNCGADLWVAGGTILVTIKQPKVVDFVYECDDCGDRFDYPSLADEHRC